MSRRILAALLALLLLGLCACSAFLPAPSPGPDESPDPSRDPEPSGEPVREIRPFALAWDPGDSLHPYRAGSANQTLVPLVFEGLFRLDGAFEPQPALCQYYSRSENGLSWTFTLRPGVVFSDGTPLTAAHAANCLNAARGSALYGARLAGVTRITAGEGTLTVDLSAPNGVLPALLDIPIFLEPEEDEGYPLGTGPYRFDNSTGELCLTSSPSWRGAEKLPVSVILLRETTSADDRIAAFDTGLVTLVDTDLTATNALGYSGSYETWDYPTTTMLYIGFNAKSGFCRDPVLRQAISRGIDRTALAESFLSGHADPAALPVSPRSDLYDEALAGEGDYSLAAASQLLEDGGYTLSDGVLSSGRRPVALTLLVNNENQFKTGLADHIASELTKLGLNVTVRKLGWDDFSAALGKGDFDLYLGQVKLTAAFDPTPLLAGELNYGGFYSAAVNELLAAFRAADHEEREQAADALYAGLSDEAPIAALCFQHGSVLTQWGSVSGLSPTRADPFYGMEHWVLS